MVSLIFVFFIVPGFVYGRVVGTMKNDRDVIDAMSATMGAMGLYIVLVFFAAQFVAFFGWTRAWADHRGQAGRTCSCAIGPGQRSLVFIPFIMMCCFVNLMLGSASATVGGDGADLRADAHARSGTAPR